MSLLFMLHYLAMPSNGVFYCKDEIHHGRFVTFRGVEARLFKHTRAIGKCMFNGWKISKN